MFTKTRLAALAAVAWMTLSPGVDAGNITYTLVDYSSLTSPTSVSGTITTDGTIGDSLSVLDHVVAWDISVYLSGASIWNFNSAITPSDLGGSSFSASATAITLLSDGDSLVFESVLDDYSVSWTQSGGFLRFEAWDPVSKAPFFQVDLPTGSPIAVAAAVPEPSTAFLAWIGAGTVIAFVLGTRTRRCRESIYMS